MLDKSSLAVDMLTGGKTFKEVTQHFKLNESSISRLRTKYPEIGNVKDSLSSG